ncbi:MAG: polysaccharide biosynthesis tyrosine autokinase [Pseudomonadota bacterium]
MYDTDRFDGETESRGGIVPQRGRSVDLYPNLQSGDYAEPDHNGFEFWSAMAVLSRRKWMILAILFLGVAAATVFTLQVTPLYKAASTIEIQTQEVQILETSAVEPVGTADAEYMATQYALLRSRSLAERVADQLKLPDDARFADQSLRRDDRLREATTEILRNLSVSPQGRSRVVNVEFVSPYPREAAQIANAIVSNFIETNLERKYNTTSYAREFIEERLATTKAALEDSERRLVEYAQQQNILELEDQGRSTSLDANSLIALNEELADAESERIALEQQWRESQSSNSTLQMLESEDLGRLRARRSDLNAEYQELLGKFKPGYPDMERLAARIDSVDEEITRERAAIVAAAEAAYRASLAREQSLTQRIRDLSSNVQSLRDRRIEYTILQREVDTNRSQYDALLQRLKEVSIASGVGSSKVSVVDRAIEPLLPFEPNLIRTLFQAIVLSLAAGIGLAFALNYIDDTVKTPDDVKTKLGLPAIGVIPRVKGKGDLIADAMSDPKSGISEAYFSTRTALQFTTENGAPRSLVVTSTKPSEGKTSTTVALAMSFAKIGQKVLIIDADMRKPSFVADPGRSAGLSGLLTRDEPLENHVVGGANPGLFLLPSGIIPPNPAELLSSPKLAHLLREAEAIFDLVIVDAPPVLGFTDAPILGSVCEASVVVVQSGGVRRPAAMRTLDRMIESRSNVIGVVLVKFDAKKAGYEYGDYYYSYGAGSYRYTERLSDSSERQRKIRIFAGSPNDTDLSA